MHDAAELLAAARRELGRLPVVLQGLLADLPRASWSARPAREEWSPVEIVCHLRDEEVEDFRARVQVVIAGGDRFESIDPERWAVERRYRDEEPATALATLARHRAESLEFLATVAPERLSGAVAHPTLGPLSGAALVAAWVAHDRLHLAQLAATLARLWANRWAPLDVTYAGPIPYGDS